MAFKEADIKDKTWRCATWLFKNGNDKAPPLPSCCASCLRTIGPDNNWRFPEHEKESCKFFIPKRK